MKGPMVKLCGNKSLEDFQKSQASGAPYLGVIFAESKRQVLPEHLASWLKQTTLNDDQSTVGVFVKPTMNELETTLHLVDIDIIQLHGRETVVEILHIKEQFDLPVWKAIHHSDDAIEMMRLYQGVVDGFVVDAKVKGAWGGSGQQFDWNAVPAYIQEGRRQGVPCFIAGGITPENVKELYSYKPDGIDVSSGTETDGQKDVVKIEAIVRGKNHVSNIS
ncbi:phosphoribosylanthranilate isomerase [Pontibacillus yanchengensis]|uniref:N-(5'-phosphoribosyl)anthranilate isomerase n=1 Tax=Pontibacillus yanchengensis Y32 TaxID=1385514 RepID=A0A0A2THZ5_9BACI|nr:phosphoribosylanthranilate isomerase [Pontibacillus yanchengensis]KGP73691.1 N-(5'-phosphoribosyl)anthranilate isomerase [Pontibacillus yanchengensis Y32]